MKEKIYKTDYKLLHNNYVNDERILYEKMFVVGVCRRFMCSTKHFLAIVWEFILITSHKYVSTLVQTLNL